MMELLVVLAIIRACWRPSPFRWYLNNLEMARVRVALTECKELADAETRCAIRHGFLCALQLLDDLAPGDEHRQELR